MYLHEEKAREEPRVVSRINQLHREVLFFSISHDHTIVKIFGHYPLIEKDKINFRQHIIKTFDLSDNDGRNRWTAYNFVRKLYDHFAPIHLQRIRDAISYLPEPSSESMSLVSIDNGSSELNSQETAIDATSQNTLTYKKSRVAHKASRTAASAREQQLKQELERQRQDNQKLMQELTKLINLLGEKEEKTRLSGPSVR